MCEEVRGGLSSVRTYFLGANGSSKPTKGVYCVLTLQSLRDELMLAFFLILCIL